MEWLNNVRTVSPNSWQRQIIVGSLLGTGFIGRDPFFGFKQPLRKADWFAHKALELKNLGTAKSVQRDSRNWIWRSARGDVWDEYRALFYEGGRKVITEKTLDGLRDIALAVWFGDRGFGGASYGLRLGRLDERSRATVRRYFHEVDMPCELLGTRLIFTETGAQEFLRCVGHCLPEFMLDDPILTGTTSRRR